MKSRGSWVRWLALAVVTGFSLAPSLALGASPSVRIKYRQPQHGYHITIRWHPTRSYRESLAGPAKVTLRAVSGGKRSTATMKHLTFSRSRLANLRVRVVDSTKGLDFRGPGNMAPDGTVAAVLSRGPLTLSYKRMTPKRPGMSWFENMHEPVFFYDLDFDKRPELILRNDFQGQRWGPYFGAYSISKSKMLVAEPYRSLDHMTSFFPRRREVQLWLSGGACNSERHTYRYKQAAGPGRPGRYFMIRKYVENSSIGGDFCTVTKYRVIHTQSGGGKWRQRLELVKRTVKAMP